MSSFSDSYDIDIFKAKQFQYNKSNECLHFRGCPISHSTMIVDTCTEKCPLEIVLCMLNNVS